MKKILFSVLLCAGVNCYAQNTFPSSGPVGIGNAVPTFDLDISGTLPYLRIHSSGYTNNPGSLTKKGGIIFNQQNGDKTAAINGAVPPGYHTPGILFSTKTAWNMPGSTSTDWYDRMFIHPNGNVGIGTTNPLATLHVSGGFEIDGAVGLPSNATASDASNYVNKNNFKLLNGNSGMFFSVSNGTNDRKAYIQVGHYDPAYAYGLGTITLNPYGGNVGIGTGNVSPGSLLTVAGLINAREVRVTVDAGADFVFNHDYTLKSLNEVEQYVNENKHLPEIASASEMEKDGIDVGKMEVKLLQKIEEMTLYMIQFNKEMEKLKAENAKLQDKITQLENK